MNKIYIKRIIDIDESKYPDVLFTRAKKYQGNRALQSMNAYALLYDIFQTEFHYQIQESDLKDYNQAINNHYYSISHSNNYCLVAISDHLLGADLESLQNIRAKEQTLKKLFGENDLIEHGMRWCYLEALYKLTNIGTMRSNHQRIKDFNYHDFVKIIKKDDDYLIVAISSDKDYHINLFSFEL